MPGRQSKCWCFTWNNYDEDAIPHIQEVVESGDAVYCIVGREVGESGTPHLQGYIAFPRKKTLAGAKKFLADSVHLESRRGTQDEAIEYCKKEGSFEEYGVPPNVRGGRRSSLDQACEIIKEGGTLERVAEELPACFVQYRRGLFDLQQTLRAKRRDWKSHVTVMWGARSGTGKSRFCRDMAMLSEDEPFVFMPSSSGSAWFDGYRGQVAAVFDDFVGTQVPFRTMLQVLDRYPCKLPIKGGSVSWCPRKVYISSNLPPSEWYSHLAGVDVRPLLRRIDTIHHVEDALYDDIQLVDYNGFLEDHRID